MPPSPPRRCDHRTVSGGSAPPRAAALFGFVAIATVSIWGDAEAAPRPAGLDAEVRATWTSVPLREWASRVSETTGVPVIVDRRLDPDIAVTLASDGDTLRVLLKRVATSATATVEPLASTTRLVPRDLAGRARAAEAARNRVLRGLPADVRRIAERRAPWNWPTAARPRDLVAAAADDAGLTVTGLDRIPHDHLPATTLPPLQLAERLDLVLADYDLRVAWSPTGGSIVPIDEGLEPSDRTAASSTSKLPTPPRRDRKATPTNKADAQPDREQKADDETVYSLRVESPLDQAVSAVAKAMGLRSTLDKASLAARGIAPGEIVRVDARDLSRDRLLDALVAPLGLAWTIDDETLRVFAPPATSATAPR